MKQRSERKSPDLPVSKGKQRPESPDLRGHMGSTNANQEIGDPPGHEGWRNRGYLPHFDAPNLIQGVTVHLADSLPKKVLERMQAQHAPLPEEDQDNELRKKIEAYLNAGHGCCILREPSIARMVLDALLFFHTQRYILFAWVIMPNHIHVLFRPINNWSLRKIVAAWKKFTARKIHDHWHTHPLDRKSPDLPLVWHPEFWDRYMRDQHHFRLAMEYIHQNPVKARLVAKPEDWPWSSANSRNAHLLMGSPSNANQEIGVPGRTP